MAERLKQQMKTVGWGLLTLALGALLWQAVYRLIHDDLIFPSLSEVGANLHPLLSGTFARDLLATLLRALVASVLAALVVVPLGIATGLSPIVAQLVSPLADFVRSLPGWILYFPLSAALRGRTLEEKHLSVLFLALGAILYLAAIESTLLAPKLRMNLAQLYGANRWYIVSRILIWEVMAALVAPLLTCLNAGIAIITATETLTYPVYGVGSRLVEWFNTGVPSGQIYGAILLLGVSGSFVALLLRTVFALMGLSPVSRKEKVEPFRPSFRT
jgi:sulfonate transport system permease protein